MTAVVDAAALLIEHDRAWWEFLDHAMAYNLRPQNKQEWQTLDERKVYERRRRELWKVYCAALHACVVAQVDAHQRDHHWFDRMDGWRKVPNPRQEKPYEIWEQRSPPMDRLP